MNEITAHLRAIPSESGFEILAISEGEAKGHGITFSAGVLQAGLSHYDNLPVFIDHPATMFHGPSLRNLAGTLHNPIWNEAEKGIQLSLTPVGPAADVLINLREAAKSDPALLSCIGFSSVLRVKTDKDGNVSNILSVRSVDAVVDPARGGKFLAAIHEGEEMENESNLTEQGNEILVSMCKTLLSTSLSASKLPEASQGAIRKQFEAQLKAGSPFTPEELETAISEKREELSKVMGGLTISGPGRIEGMSNSDDAIKAAFSDLFDTPRDEGLEKVKPARLSGIREAYLMLTGDYDLHGGYDSEHMLGGTTTDFTGLVKNALNKLVVKGSDLMGKAGYKWWEEIVTVEKFNSLQSITGTLVGSVGALPTVAEQGEYNELPIGDSPETASWEKFGGYIPLTLEAIDRDETRRIRDWGLELGKASVRNVSEQIAEIFTVNSAIGPTMADGGALFNATAVTTAGGHVNLLTTALGTDYTAWAAVATAVYNQPMLLKQATGYYGTGKKQAIEPKYCLVPRALADQAKALFLPRWASAVEAVATLGGPSYAGFVKPLTVPEWTDATDWAAVCEPSIAPAIFVGHRFGMTPEVFVAGKESDPAVFMNDEHRIKIRHFLAIWVNDFRPLHKSNV